MRAISLFKEFDGGHFTSCAFARLDVLDMHQQIGEPAFNRLKMAEPGIRGVELLHQRSDAIFEVTDRGIVAARKLYLLDLVGERMHQRFKLRRDNGAALRPVGECIRQRIDALLKVRQGVAAAGSERDLLDALREALHLGGKVADHFVRGHMRADIAQRADGMLELLHRRRVLLGDDHVDLVRQSVNRVVEADEVLGRGEVVQCVTDLGEPLLDAGQRAAVDAGLPSLGDALGKPCDLPLDGIERALGHGLGQRVRDTGEFVAQGVDRVLDTRLAQRLDLTGDGAQLLL